MLQKRVATHAIGVMLFLVGACSIIKNEDPQKDVRDFLTTFQQQLSLPDQEILKQFKTDQSRQSILAAIVVLQNKEQFITCDVQYKDAQITSSEAGLQVTIPVTFQSKDIDDVYVQNSTLNLWLTRENNSFVISKLEAEDFYQTFTSIKNQIAWSVSQKEELAARAHYIERAKELQQEYDSVIWYARHNDKVYYYVIKGNWDVNNFIHGASRTDDIHYRMGLLDEKGNVIIPVDYDLVGTIGFTFDNVLEVKKDGKAGFFNLEGKPLTATDYDVIIPYEKENISAIVKKDSVYGWLDKDFLYRDGFPNTEAREYLATFSYIPQQFKFSEQDQTLCEIPNEEYIGYGVVIPPTFWTTTGLVDQVMTGFVIEGLAMRAFTEYIETKNTFIDNIATNVNAMVTTIRERYLEGREEFYTRNRISFVNAQQDTLYTTEEVYGSSFEVKRIGENIIEVKSYVDQDHDSYIEEDIFDTSIDFDLPNYVYFEIDEEMQILPLNSNRRYAFTEFISMDENYINGTFKHYDSASQTVDVISVLSDETLVYMRNEILASNGYRFPEESVFNQFKELSWYKPEYDSYDDVVNQLSDIDKHNLAFLNKKLGNDKPIKKSV